MEKKVEKTNLGLPLEYQQMPEYFDAHNVSEETDAKNAVIERLLKEQSVKTVLDMTCGTGSQVFYLQQRGYEVTGSDFSPALIEQAKNKAKAQGKEIAFIDGDMRDLKVGQFDAVITMFNAIGHVSKSDFEKTMQNIHGNLQDGGIYIFDIFNLQAITDEVIHGFNMNIQTTQNGTKIRNQQYSEVDRANRLLTSHDHYTITKEEREPEIYTNSFSLQIYTAKELKEMLAQNGFATLHQYDLEGNDFIADKSLNILTVARKI
ncbi:MAG: class I SAM-dependent methyltransferase [Proteobacteria bacterium]|nr:class I SAM-dependent methyltransferase [Pseudomonadota bacterium]